MGWKSTITLTREEAICAIITAITKTQVGFSAMSNEQLSIKMEELGIGDDLDLPYFGHNFSIENK